SKALADETRIRLLAACVHAADAGLAEDVCVCQLIELVGLAPSTVSRHLAILRDAGLLEPRRDGKWIYYRPVDEGRVSPAAAGAIDLLRQSLRADAPLQRDAASLRAILALDPEALCKTQRPGAPSSGSACCSSAPGTPAAARWRKDGPTRSAPTASTRDRRGPTPTA
ncbi:MAG: ArsR/SmtB family transcription factor, partial [Phycisphaerales bacterium]